MKNGLRTVKYPPLHVTMGWSNEKLKTLPNLMRIQALQQKLVNLYCGEEETLKFKIKMGKIQEYRKSETENWTEIVIRYLERNIVEYSAVRLINRGIK